MSLDETNGRAIVPTEPNATMHTDSADVGYGSTLNMKDLRAGVCSMWCDQRMCNWKDRASSITSRELKEIRVLLMGGLGTEVQRKTRWIFCCMWNNRP